MIDPTPSEGASEPPLSDDAPESTVRGESDSRDESPACCPNCKSRDVRRSLSRGPFDAMVGLFGYKPHRCRWCRARYFSAE